MTVRLPITHLHHVGLRVPDPEAAAAFYTRVLGLGETGRAFARGGIRLSTLPRNAKAVSHHELILYEGEPSGLDHMALAVNGEVTLTQVADLLRSRGQVVEGPRDFEGVHGPSIRLRDPAGVTVEVIAAPPPVPRPAGQSLFGLVKIGHVNLKSPAPPQQALWWQQVMDFRLSDRMGETFYWLRCNPDHTTVAIVRSAAPGIHHIALESSCWEDIRHIGDHFTANGVQIEFGPGRHGPGNGIFIYFLDPWWIRWEILCEMSRVDDNETPQPGLWDQETRTSAVNLWGPLPPESFIAW